MPYVTPAAVTVVVLASLMLVTLMLVTLVLVTHPAAVTVEVLAPLVLASLVLVTLLVLLVMVMESTMVLVLVRGGQAREGRGQRGRVRQTPPQGEPLWCR